jgi:hypothetical protein
MGLKDNFIGEKKMKEEEGISKIIGKEEADVFTKQLKEKLSKDENWELHGHILIPKLTDEELSLITRLRKDKHELTRKNLELGIAKHPLDMVINQHIAHERLMRNKPNEDKKMIWEISANELKTRGYGGLIHNIKNMADPSNIEEINEILQLAYYNYGGTTIQDTDNNEFYQHLKDKRTSLHYSIIQAIDSARKDKKYPISKMEILGTLELVKLFYFKHDGDLKTGA